jgi:hypothetical protein
MAPVRIALVLIGDMPPDLVLDRTRSWKSTLFELVDGVPSFALTQQSDGPDWEYSDEALSKDLPSLVNADCQVALVNVPLEDNYYVRRLEGSRVVMSLHEVDEIMRAAGIPVENAVLRVLYATALVFRRFGNQVPVTGDFRSFTHDDTRGCLFDMNGLKSGLARSCHRPIICQECSVALVNNHVASSLVSAVRREILEIQKPLYTRIIEVIKAHPVLALVVSSIAAIVLGAIGSLLASLLYDHWK